MKGYKMMESDMTCNGFQYEVGKEYSLEGELEICESGFHFCENPFNCLYYYNNIGGDKRLFSVKALGIVINDNNKSVTNKIKIIEEIPNIEKFFDENIDNFKVDYYRLMSNQKLSEEFIDKYNDKVNWNYISRCQTLSESFIEKYNDKLSWYNISIYQKLSESFIEKYIDKVDWDHILKYQTLSKKFIRKHNIISWLKKLLRKVSKK